MDIENMNFGKSIGNGLLKTTCDDLKNLEDIICDILMNHYSNDSFYIKNTICRNPERLTKTLPYEEYFRTIGSNIGINLDFANHLDLNELKTLINQKLDEKIGVNKISLKNSNIEYLFDLEILVSFKEWKSLNNGAHIDYLKTQLENEYADKYFGEKFKNQYIEAFDELLSNKQITNYNVKVQLEAYFKNNTNNDIDDYLKDLEQIHLDALNDHQYEFNIYH